MNYTIDISKDNIRQYTSEELRGLADKGLLYSGDFCLSEFVNKILVDMYTENEVENKCDQAKTEAVDYFEVERAIRILQDAIGE